MATVEKAIGLLREIRENPDRYLPITDHAWKVFPKKDEGKEWYDDTQHNIGWNAGLLEGNRPYFLEVWATCGITMLTYFVCTRGIEEMKTGDLIRMLEEAKLFRLRDPENPRAEVMRFEEDGGNAFYSVNIVCGDEEGVYADG